MTILVVDDSEENRYQLEVLLKAHGYEVVCATQGAEALAIARDHPPDLIVSDILMPVMDGFTLCREWKRDARLRHIPFVFYTATYTDAKDRELALSLGAARFVLKPDDNDIFLKEIREAIQEASRSPVSAVSDGVMPELSDTPFLQRYNEALIRKLEDKMRQLEQANRELVREMAARELAETARREVQTIIHRSPLVVFLWQAEAEWPVEYVSDNVRQFGYPPEDFMSGGLRYTAIVHPEDLPRLLEDVARYAEEPRREGWVQQYRIRTKAGAERWVEVSMWIRRNAAGQITHYQGIMLDITERCRAEEEREQLRAQLLQAQKLEAIGTLAAGVAHEINNPMMGVMNYAELIAERVQDNAELAEFANRIQQEAQRIEGLIRNLLTFARHDQGPFSTARLSEIVSDTLSLIRAVLRHDQIRLEVDIPEDLPPVRCRKQQLQQVLMNLLTNARDALNERYPQAHKDKRVRITAQAINGRRGDSPQPRRWIRLTVEDHGIGISEEIRARIFDPFFTTKPAQRGTGLGLSISHGIVREHGGFLTAESVPGQWTRFHVDLPVTEELGQRSTR